MRVHFEHESVLGSWECTWIVGVHLDRGSALGSWDALGSAAGLWECTSILGMTKVCPKIQMHPNIQVHSWSKCQMQQRQEEIRDGITWGTKTATTLNKGS